MPPTPMPSTVIRDVELVTATSGRPLLRLTGFAGAEQNALDLLDVIAWIAQHRPEFLRAAR